MAAPNGAFRPGAEAQQGELGELLRLEAQLAERATALEVEAQRIRAEATATRASAEADASARLDAELTVLSTRLDSERQGRIQQIALTAAQEADRLRGIDDARLEALAEGVAQRVVAAALEEGAAS